MSQIRIFEYKGAMQSRSFNQLQYKTKNAGIYEGLQISKVNDLLVNVGPGTFIINDDTAKVSVKVRNDDASTQVTVSSVNNIIILRMIWVDALSQTVSYTAVPLNQVLTSDVIIAKINYSGPGGTLLSADYSFRTYGNSENEGIILDPQSNVLWRSSANFWYIGSDGYTIKYINEIKDNNSYSTLAVSAGNYYLVYDGTGYATESETNTVSYDNIKNGWYMDVSKKKALAYFYYNGSNSITIKSYLTKNNIVLESRGLTDNSISKNLGLSNNFDWTSLHFYESGMYFITGTGQTNSPDASTNKDWHIEINAKGNDAINNCVIYANRKDTNKKFSINRISGVWGNWKPISLPRTSTVVVASSTSLDKYSADYICDGTDDDIVIQAAIDYVNSIGGGEVKLLEGTYNITTNILPKSNINIEGQGYSTIFSGASSYIFNIANSLTNINFKNFKIDGSNNSGILQYSTSLLNISYTDIFISGASASSFTNCTNLINCIASSNVGVTVRAFNGCINLTECYAYSNSSSGGGATNICTGFYQCSYLENCKSNLNIASITNFGASGYFGCSYLTNCLADSNGGTTSNLVGDGFNTCNHLTNCVSTNNNATIFIGRATGYYQCTYVNYCIGSNNTCTGAGWGFYQCTRCQQNTGTGNTTALQTGCFADNNSNGWALTAAGGYNG